MEEEEATKGEIEEVAVEEEEEKETVELCSIKPNIPTYRQIALFLWYAAHKK